MTTPMRIAALVAFSTALFAAQPGYFPLHPGNQWVYRIDGRAHVMEVGETATFGEREYSLVRGYWEGDAWLRITAEGDLVAYDPETKSERLWAAFSAAEGARYRSEIPPCNQEAVIVSKSAKYAGPALESDSALEIDYRPGSCADAGIDSETYLPGIGLVRRTSVTIAGPRTAELIYARIGGTTVLSAKERAFSLGIDRAEYTTKGQTPTMIARFTLRNTHEEPLELVFPTGQIYDLAIRNEAGETVYRWAEGKFFTQAVQRIKVGSGEKNWVVAIPLGAHGKPFPQSLYTVEAWLTNSGPSKFSAMVGFEIRHIQEPAAHKKIAAR